VRLSKIALHIGSTLAPGAADLDIQEIASLDSAGEHSITFLSNPRFAEAARACRAGAIIVKKGCRVENKVNLEVDDPYLGYAKAALLFEDTSPVFGTGVHPSAIIDSSARIAAGVSIGPGTVIGQGCAIGANTVIGANCVIERDTEIGNECRIDSGAIIRYKVRIGNRVIIQSGSVIGSDGFANAMEKGAWVRIPCFGAVIIEDDVQIGAGTTIDRGNFEPTIIHTGARLDNLIQIAHNVVVGEHTAMAAQVGVAGSTRIGKHVMVGGQAGFVNHIEVGDGVFVGAQAGVMRDIAAGTKVTGTPAHGLTHMMRMDAISAELPDLVKKLKKLLKQDQR
jgi:UDP-3-O-[3-hydroxymyristoyl] glucosamine N-acyltransferase